MKSLVKPFGVVVWWKITWAVTLQMTFLQVNTINLKSETFLAVFDELLMFTKKCYAEMNTISIINSTVYTRRQQLLAS